MNDLIWRVDNKAWLAARNSEWKQVVENLKLMELEVDRKAHKYHKHLFIYGEMHPDVVDMDAIVKSNLLGIRIFEGKEIFYRMWYHPEPNLELFKEMVEQQDYSDEIEGARQLMFNRYSQNDFASNYGMCGGREEFMVKALVPSADYSEKRAFPNAAKEISLGLSPESVYRFCVPTTSGLLKYPTNPFSPGQYLWDHLDFAVQRHWKKALGDLGQNYLRVALYRILDFYERPGKHQKWDHALKLREHLFERFEARDFGKRLMGFWLEEKARFEAGDSEPSLG